MTEQTNSPTSMTIGTLGLTCGVSAPTIRYYEQIGLLPEAERSRSGQRRYGHIDIERLTFIRRSRAFGFSTKQVSALMAVHNGSAADCNASQDIARARITEIRSKIEDLVALEKSLKSIISTCEETCAGESNQTCGAFIDMKMPV